MTRAHQHLDQVNLLLVAQLVELLELRQAAAPDPERARLLEQVRTIRDLRNRIAHGLNVDQAKLTEAVTTTLASLVALEASTLGTPGAQRLRSQSDPHHIADILQRQESMPGTGHHPREAGPDTGPDQTWIIRKIGPGAATKPYRCPGCGHQIAPGVGHIVAWPADQDGPDERRHWHTGCWQAQQRPAPTTRRRSRADTPRTGEQPLEEAGFLTVAQAATTMGVSKMTVYRLVHANELPAIRVGRSLQVPEQAVIDYLAQAHQSNQVS